MTDWRQDAVQIAGLELLPNEPMAQHTTYKVGGAASAFVEVRDMPALRALLDLLDARGVAYVILGNGSNVLFSDAGYQGAVIHLGAGFKDVALRRDHHGPGVHRLEMGAGLTITRLLRVLKEEQISGVEFLGGVPGTVGGAVRMNAGTVLGEVKDTLESAQLIVPGQPPYWLDVDVLGMSYRHSQLPAGAVVTAARFRCTEAQPDTRDRLDHVLAYRKQTQPLQRPSCGSVFANPPGDHAGRLIEAAGLKGTQVGGAQVSEMHANWIVNVENATARDIADLIDRCVEQVRVQHGVTLRHEVQLLGDWE